MDVIDNGKVTVSNTSDHREVLVNYLWHSFVTQQGVDCEVLCGGRSVRAHRLLLDAFQFGRQMTDLKQELKIKDHKWNQNLDLLMEFLYKGHVTVHKEELPGLLDAATELNFRMLIDATKVQMEAQVKAERIKIEELRECYVDMGQRVEAPVTSNSNWSSADEMDSTVMDESNVSDSINPMNGAKRGPRRKKASASYRCQFCSFKSGRRSKYVFHQLTIHHVVLGKVRSAALTPDSQPQKCKTVDRRRSGNGLTQPRRKVRCPQCSRHFKNLERLSQHFDSSHPSIEQFHCEACGEKFPLLQGLLRHNESAHSGERLKCRHCCFSVKEEEEEVLQRHTQHVHLGIKPFACSDCEKGFFTRANLEEHQRSHSKPRRKRRNTSAKFKVTPASGSRSSVVLARMAKATQEGLV